MGSKRGIWPAVIASVGVLALAGCAGVKATNTADSIAADARATAITPAMLALPESAYEEGHYAEALRLYRELLVRDPNNKVVKLGIADSELGANDLMDANRLYEELASDPGLHARVLQGQGIALIRMGQNSAAEKALKGAVAADPKLWRAWNALGALEGAAQNWSNADDAYAKALAIEANSPILHNNLGFSLLCQGKTKAAIKSFQTALGIDPTLQAAQMNLRIALALEGRYDDAVAGVQDLNRAATLNNIGFAAMARGDYAKAEGYFTQAIDAGPAYEEMASKNLKELKALTGKDTGASGGT